MPTIRALMGPQLLSPSAVLARMLRSKQPQASAQPLAQLLWAEARAGGPTHLQPKLGASVGVGQQVIPHVGLQPRQRLIIAAPASATCPLLLLTLRLAVIAAGSGGKGAGHSSKRASGTLLAAGVSTCSPPFHAVPFRPLCSDPPR